MSFNTVLQKAKGCLHLSRLSHHMFHEFIFFLHIKSYPLAVLLETAEQTLRPGMYDLIVFVNFPVPIIVIKITQTFQI